MFHKRDIHKTPLFIETGVSPEDEAFTIDNLKAKVFGAFSWDNFFYAIIFGLAPTSWDVISDGLFAKRLTGDKDNQSAGLCYLFVVMPITSARSTKLSAEYSHEDSGSSVARGEEGGIVLPPPAHKC